MKLNQISKEDLELMGYDDIAYIILQESGKKMKLIDIFKKVCQVLELPDNTVEDQLMDFFEQMSINKKFTMLANGFWDLQSRHKTSIVVEDEDNEEDIVEDMEDIEEDITEEDEDDIFYEDDEDHDDVDDDLSDLMIVDEDEENAL